MNTPILLITFNRPDHTCKVLERILEAQPKDLYVFQDGVREDNENDAIKCQQVRDVVAELVGCDHLTDGQQTLHSPRCTLHFYGSPVNLGCGPGPMTAITWFFDNVEQGIVMEDDIIPHPIFFPFMETMLTRYANDSRIGMVAGHNFYRKYSLFNSYYFTFDTEGTLGWGTWRRVWQKMNFNIAVRQKECETSLRKNFGFSKLYARKEYMHFNRVLSVDRRDRWDYQWEYCLKLNGYLNIKSNSCLTTHEDGGDATHMGCYYSPNYKMEVHLDRLSPIRHPKWVHIDPLEKLRLWKRTFRIILHKS